MFFLVLLDADCSGRALASLLIAWVTIAMIASILLEWNYMWIVLMVLTLLFLFICGYIAYNVKKTNARILIEQQRRAAIRTISSITAANRREMESSYQAHLHVDLPPSYTSVVTTQTTTSPRTSDDDKYEDPPPYSIVIASLNTQERNAEISSESDMTSSKFRKNSATDAASASTSLACPHGR
ncbi:uncharacterized protein LOC126857534 isoform X2 [Cataglyphis hispanica]|uniref:uncharacterized protein LOC126857534 isoform X2 n=1 Tax=Cataglyphis hispanica TaxID=1086592 RepID=UPI00217FF239|nr:uncharacterized protein LOC126857534 isoform X2 [Cataglyphis hispanica]